MRTSKPELRTELAASKNAGIRQLIRQLSELYGVGVMLQTDAGAWIPVRVNTQNNSLEAYSAGKWQTVTSSEGKPNPSTSSAYIPPDQFVRLAILSAKGDIAVCDGAAWRRLPSGENGKAIIADSSERLGLKYGGHGDLAGLDNDDHSWADREDGSRKRTGPIYMTEISTPSNPDTGAHKLYCKNDGKWYTLSPTGSETLVGPSTQGEGISTFSSPYAGRPSPSNDGNLFFPTDAFTIDRDSTTAWSSWGPIFPLIAPPDITAWTWVNQGTSTVTPSKNGYLLTAQVTASDPSLRCLVKSAPSTPYTITAVILPRLLVAGSTYPTVGLLFRESSTGKIVTCGYTLNGATAGTNNGVSRYNSPTSWNTSIAGNACDTAFPVFLSIADDGTNRHYLWSRDGQNWITLLTESRTTFITANQVGIFVNNCNGTYANSMLLLSWKES